MKFFPKRKKPTYSETTIKLKESEVVKGWYSTWWLTEPDSVGESHVGGHLHCVKGPKPGNVSFTSVVKEIDRKNMLVRTENSVYALGVEIDISK